MKFNEKHFNRIIKESIRRYINEVEQVAVNCSNPDEWKPYDDGYDGKMRRMQSTGKNPSYDAEMKKKQGLPKKSYNVNPPSYNEWDNNFRHMPYRVYVEKRKNGEL